MVYPRADSDLRLKQAVRRHRALSREGLLEQLFERLFRGLVYTQIWEDPEVDLEALALKPDDQVALTWSGLIDYANGAFDRARAELDAAIAQNGAWPRANYARALVRETLGDQSGAFRDMTAARRYTETPADWSRVQTEMSRFRRGPWCGERLPCAVVPSGNIPNAGCGCGP